MSYFFVVINFVGGVVAAYGFCLWYRDRENKNEKLQINQKAQYLKGMYAFEESTHPCSLLVYHIC